MSQNRDPYHKLRLAMRDVLAADDENDASDDDWFSTEALQETIGQGYKLINHEPEVLALAIRLAHMKISRTFEGSVIRLLEQGQMDESSHETVLNIVLKGLREIRLESAHLEQKQMDLQSERDSLENRLYQIEMKENRLYKKKMEVEGRISVVKRAYGNFMGWSRREANRQLGSDDEWDGDEDDDDEGDDDEGDDDEGDDDEGDDDEGDDDEDLDL